MKPASFASTLLLGMAPAALAQGTTQTTLEVTASVPATCVVSSAAHIHFGDYSPFAGGVDAEGQVSIACTKGALARVSLDAGQNPSGAARSMRLAQGNDLLRYQLYRDAQRGSPWDPQDEASATSSSASVPIVFGVYGRIPAGQDPTVGSYTDTVVVTVLF
jgi:spore coat protein U-like protein